jgi:peptidyl-tRNA hydrolase, PTH1 family
MKLIVGLGNPGPEYHNTRHNIGFQSVDAVAQKLNALPFEQNKKLHGLVTKTPQAILLKPQTFMNLSGESVQAVATFYKILPTDIWVIHDEVDIEGGRIKIQKGGGSAGHNGIKSIIEKIGADFNRWRVGVGKPLPEDHLDTADYVLNNFTSEQEVTMKTVIGIVTESVEFALQNDIIASMNKYN